MGLISRSRRRAEDRVLLVDVVSPPASDPLDTLFGVVVEAVVLQDEAEAVLAAVARHEHLGILAPRGGPLVGRFFALRDRLPRQGLEHRGARIAAQLDTILLHHAMQVATSLEFLAAEGRSEQLAHHVSTISGLGAAAEVLDEIYRELRTERER